MALLPPPLLMVFVAVNIFCKEESRCAKCYWWESSCFSAYWLTFGYVWHYCSSHGYYYCTKPDSNRTWVVTFQAITSRYIKVCISTRWVCLQTFLSLRMRHRTACSEKVDHQGVCVLHDEDLGSLKLLILSTRYALCNGLWLSECWEEISAISLLAVVIGSMWSEKKKGINISNKFHKEVNQGHILLVMLYLCCIS